MVLFASNEVLFNPEWEKCQLRTSDSLVVILSLDSVLKLVFQAWNLTIDGVPDLGALDAPRLVLSMPRALRCWHTAMGPRSTADAWLYICFCLSVYAFDLSLPVYLFLEVWTLDVGANQFSAQVRVPRLSIMRLYNLCSHFFRNRWFLFYLTAALHGIMG